MVVNCWVLDTCTGPKTLDQIGDGLAAMWEAYPRVSHTVRIQVGIAVAEIGANIVEHAAGDRQVRLRVRVRVLSDKVKVLFTDDGRPADLDLGAVTTPGEMAERGRGLAMAQSVLDLLDYRRLRSNHWTLVSKPFS